MDWQLPIIFLTSVITLNFAICFVEPLYKYCPEEETGLENPAVDEVERVILKLVSEHKKQTKIESFSWRAPKSTESELVIRKYN